MNQRKVKDFIHKGRRCIIIEMNVEVSGKYCNGFVELKKDEIKDSYDDYDITSDEMIYQGDLSNTGFGDGKTYIGFDSSHFWNNIHPESKKSEYVEKTCKKIVDELNNLKVKK